MGADSDPPDAVTPVDGTDPRRAGQAQRDEMLLAATVEELRERAERLHRATDDLAAQNERLLEAQRAVEAERARYRELFELAPDPWLLTDASGTIVDANHGVGELLALRTEALVRTPLAAFVEASSRDAFGDVLERLRDAGGRKRFALRVAPRDRAAVDVEATVSAVPERGDGGALLWLLRDVSEHVGRARSLGARLTETTVELERTREHAESERVHLQDLLQRLEEGVIAIDAQLEVAYANAAAKDLFLPVRLAEAAPLPLPWPDVDLAAFVRTLFTRRPRLRELHVNTSSGRALSLRGIPAAGSATAGLVITDVTARERRERAEREFVTNAAHELRTPLTAITSAVEALQRGAKDDASARDRFLEHIERECDRLARLTTSLLVLARAQMGVESPRLELVPIRPLLEQVAADMRPASGVRVEVACAPNLAAFANRALVEQALGNIAANAAKHTRQGTIVLRGTEQGRRWVSLEVGDTGSGIRSADQERLTERFYRAGDEPGFGLGLAIAAESARALGGRLEIESDPGRGTTARFVLPSAEVVSVA